MFSPSYKRNGGSHVVTDREGSTLVFQDLISEEILRSHALWARVDGLWRILTASEGFSALISTDTREIMGTKIFELFTPECAVSIGDRLIEATGTHTPFVIECVVLDASPSEMLRMHGVPQDGGEGYVLVFERWE